MFEQIVPVVSSPAPSAEVFQLHARRPGWTVSEHPSGMLIWRSPTGRCYLRHPRGKARAVRPERALGA